MLEGTIRCQMWESRLSLMDTNCTGAARDKRVIISRVEMETPFTETSSTSESVKERARTQELSLLSTRFGESSNSLQMKCPATSISCGTYCGAGVPRCFAL